MFCFVHRVELLQLISKKCVAVFMQLSKLLCSGLQKKLHVLLRICLYFFRHFNDTRVVIDCIEVPIETPKSLRSGILTYSHYNSGDTVKVLLAITPSGMISFVSKLYGGKASDNCITERSDILSQCWPHVDAVMVDTGFTVDKICSELGLKLYHPPFFG